ncbi:MAG: hypothetical protein IKY94_03720 [Lachnospiraceae bacterium]|nr:hypothetical protein [Lachnospiraceae bacterium]
MEGSIVLIFFLALFIILIYKGIIEKKRSVEKLKTRFQEEYGKANKRQLKDEELERISHYWKDRMTEHSIDELTWNDLDMDLVYEQMAYTRSSLGDDYLYYLLRNPVTEEKVLINRERKIACLSKNQELRIKLQVIFAQMGRIRDYSLADYLKYLMKEEPRSNLKHYVIDILIVVSIFLMAYNMGLGWAAFFLLILYNIVMYFKDKAYLEPYLISLRYLFKIKAYAKEILDLLPVEWQEEKKQLQEILQFMKKMEKNSFLVMSPGRMAGEGLELLLDYLRMCFHLDIIKFNNMLSLLQKQEEEIWKLYEIMGETDACIAIAEYRAFLPQTVCPVFHEEKEIHMVKGYHPLIEKAVPNSLEMKKNVLLTGSNASGKSTFLKTLGINVLLAQTIHTCLAEEFQMPFCSLYTSMSLKDNLTLKESYYMAEIKAIKRILDAAKRKNMVVCMVDEVLRGTNTMERIAASTQILKSMTNKNIICMAATHDVELTKTLEKEYDNYHFEESMIEEDVVFSYQLREGRATSCNAINLLEHLGYDKNLIENARIMVRNFEEQGEWICR